MNDIQSNKRKLPPLRYIIGSISLLALLVMIVLIPKEGTPAWDKLTSNAKYLGIMLALGFVTIQAFVFSGPRQKK